MGILLADVLEADRPDPELLLRYIDDPTSLSEEERQTIEWHVAHTPGCRAQVDLLRRIDFEALADVPLPVSRDSGPMRGSAPVIRMQSRRRPRRWYLAVPAAAAAVIAAWLLSQPTSDPPAQRVAVVEPESAEPKPSRPESAAPQAAPPSAGRETESTASAPSSPDPSVVAASPTDRSQRAPGGDSPSEASRALAQSETADPDAASAAPVDAAAVESIPPPDSRPTQAQLFAMRMPTYTTPAGAAPRPLRSSALRGTTPATNAAPEIRTLVPEHVARTRQARPTLYWSLDRVPTEDSVLEFAVLAPDAIDPLIRRPLELPTQPGIQSIEILESDPELPSGVELRWSISLRERSQRPGEDLLAVGWIERVPVSADLEQRLSKADPLDRAAILSEAGLWYDALEAAASAARRWPDQPRLAQAVESLLDSAGL